MAAGIDWNALLDLAHRHGLLPLLHHHLQNLEGVAMPQPYRDALRDAFVENAGRALRLTGELQQLLQLFREQDIPVLPYKGPVLAAQLYGSIALRQAGDLDILIRRSDLVRVRELLLAREYRPAVQLSSAVEAKLVETFYHQVFYRKDIKLEVHWGFAPAYFPFSLGIEALLSRIQQVRIGTDFVPALSPRDLLLVLPIHGARHGWDRLEGICSIAELLCADSSQDWDALVERAMALGSHRMLLLALALAHDLLNAHLPAQLEQRARSDRQVQYLAAEVRQSMFTDGGIVREGETLRRDVARFRMMDRSRDRLRYIVHRLMKPPYPSGLRWVLVGRVLIPLHRVLRPLELAGRAGGWVYERLRTRLRSAHRR
ncbi:MAG: nucleotidyltransferase family protein [Gemmatimonadetes bacterium]|nr:nucleotidyltransferase family protein [Gemmatimonadota bacterium]